MGVTNRLCYRNTWIWIQGWHCVSFPCSHDHTKKGQSILVDLNKQNIFVSNDTVLLNIQWIAAVNLNSACAGRFPLLSVNDGIGSI